MIPKEDLDLWQRTYDKYKFCIIDELLLYYRKHDKQITELNKIKMALKTELFKKYLNNTFVETGSYLGDGVQQAINAGYKKIISIELSDKYHSISTNRFSSNLNVSIIKGDSFKVLPNIIENINEKVTFWLDGHHSCGDTALGQYWSPLMQELNVIKSHHIKTHTIMIDDMRCWELPNPTHGFHKEDIFKKLLEINSEYKFTYQDNHVKNDILIAHL